MGFFHIKSSLMKECSKSFNVKILEEMLRFTDDSLILFRVHQCSRKQENMKCRVCVVGIYYCDFRDLAAELLASIILVSHLNRL